MKEETKDPGALIFHYDREERMASLPDHVRERGRKSVFRGNRSLLITLIDVVFLAMLVVVFSVVVHLLGDSKVLPGYSVSAKASEFGDRVLVSIKVEAREERNDAEQIRIRIGYPEGGERIEIAAFLPTGKGTPEIYRGSLVGKEGERRISIDFFRDDGRGSMTVKIQDE